MKPVGADYISLQETRHRGSPTWACALARQWGWQASFSPPPPVQRANSVRQGGTALLWQRKDKSAPMQFALPAEEAHRACGRVFADLAVVSFYGHASRLDLPTVSCTLRSTLELRKPCLIVGDFNYRAAYGDLALALGGTLSPVVHSVQVSDRAAPTRAFGFYGVPVETATTSCRPVPGVPDHKAVCYQCVLPGAQCRDAAKPPGSASELRFRRCATFTWHKLPSPEQVQQLQQVTRESTLTADNPFASLEGKGVQRGSAPRSRFLRQTC